MRKINIGEMLQFITPERLEKMKSVLENRTRYLTVVLENLYDLRNASAVVRSCEAFWVQDINIVELGNPFEISRRVSQGSHNWVSLYI